VIPDNSSVTLFASYQSSSKTPSSFTLNYELDNSQWHGISKQLILKLHLRFIHFKHAASWWSRCYFIHILLHFRFSSCPRSLGILLRIPYRKTTTLVTIRINEKRYAFKSFLTWKRRFNSEPVSPVCIDTNHTDLIPSLL